MQQLDRKRFLEEEMFTALNNLEENAAPLWGKMNAQQMLEHLVDFFKISTQEIEFPLFTPEDHIPRYREFLYSEKNFKENTKAPANILGEIPLPLRSKSLIAAKSKLQQTVNSFFEFYEKKVGHKAMHPVFGMLDFDEWVMLHYKHVSHHFRQFHLMPGD